jgi:Ca2+-binding EF-hand superfamily protein
MEIEEAELDIIYSIYKEIDVHNSKNIQPVDIFTYMNTTFNACEKAVFQIFDADRSGKFNFLEFICALWNFLTIPEHQLGAILYLIKDFNGELRIRCEFSSFICCL